MTFVSRTDCVRGDIRPRLNPTSKIIASQQVSDEEVARVESRRKSNFDVTRRGSWGSWGLTEANSGNQDQQARCLDDRMPHFSSLPRSQLLAFLDRSCTMWVKSRTCGKMKFPPYRGAVARKLRINPT
jgi:hypothetical protein